MQRKIEQIFLDLEIIAFELVAFNTRFYSERIFLIWCQYVKKEPQGCRYYQSRIFRADIL